jgi:hypothetical protein
MIRPVDLSTVTHGLFFQSQLFLTQAIHQSIPEVKVGVKMEAPLAGSCEVTR